MNSKRDFLRTQERKILEKDLPQEKRGKKARTETEKRTRKRIDREADRSPDQRRGPKKINKLDFSQKIFKFNEM